MRVEYVILGTSILNLILLAVNLYLLQHGYSQAKQPMQIIVVQQGTDTLLGSGGEATAHLVTLIGKRGTLHYFEGEQKVTTILRLPELQKHEGAVADLYVVPRLHQDSA